MTSTSAMGGSSKSSESVNSPGTARVARLVPAAREGGGAGVRIACALGREALPNFDPFIRLAHFSAETSARARTGFPDHPHRGFETLTYMLEGHIAHGDSRGNSGTLGPGAAQRMTAGRGIVHSELSLPVPGHMDGFQLWLNLPAREKMCEPRYCDVPAEDIPCMQESGASVRVISGRYGDAVGPLSGGTTEPVFLDVSLDAQSSIVLDIPHGHRALACVFEGNVRLGSDAREVSAEHVAIVQGDRLAASTGERPGRFLLIAGKPLAEPIVAYGPFVMNTADEIHQAISDYQAGRF